MTNSPPHYGLERNRQPNQKQREYLGYTREQFSELLDVTPKFCANIELGVKGMSIQTLCKISQALRLSTEFILWVNPDRRTLILSC